MKKILFALLFCFSAMCSFSQTAVNFSCNDCQGNPHDLFNELNSGKIIVICWVMPCGVCISPAITAYNIVQNFQVTHPNKVFLYIVDDFANTSCASLDLWKTNNGITNAISFSDTTIKMSDYGTAGMPKTVVVGGANHHVYYNNNNSVDSMAMQAAIQDALTPAGLNENKSFARNISLYPNPGNEKVNLKFEMTQSSDIRIQLIDIEGRPVKTIYSGHAHSGENQFSFPTDLLPPAAYTVQIQSGNEHMAIPLLIAR